METNITFPQGVSPFALQRIPEHLREDAAQEAWLAMLEGRSPDAAVVAFARKERRRARRERKGGTRSTHD